MSLHQKIKSFLDSSGIEYIESHHEATITSEDSARARGEPMKIGAKALLVKAGNEFHLAILPADRKLDLHKLGELLGARISFANPDELFRVTGCTKGAVPPFGHLLGESGVPMIVDKALFENDMIAFNAGSLTDSIKMKSSDYRKIVQPREGEFSIISA